MQPESIIVYPNPNAALLLRKPLAAFRPIPHGLVQKGGDILKERPAHNPIPRRQCACRLQCTSSHRAGQRCRSRTALPRARRIALLERVLHINVGRHYEPFVLTAGLYSHRALGAKEERQYDRWVGEEKGADSADFGQTDSGMV